MGYRSTGQAAILKENSEEFNCHARGKTTAVLFGRRGYA
jgi:hypothetical protein